MVSVVALMLHSLHHQVNPATVPVPQSGFEQRHKDKVAQVSKHKFNLLMIGDSITHNFEKKEYQPIWRQFFGPRNAINLGYSGARTENIIWNLQNGELTGQSPKVVTLMIGTNNLGIENRRDPVNSPKRNTVPEAVEGVTAVVKELRKDFPNAKILLLSIFPRDDDALAKEQIPQVNKEIAKLDDQQHVYYLDLTKNFLGADGNLLPDAFGTDKLHPTAKGYQIWADAIKEPLAKLLK
jgi:lysophospholipase L1-like esterase